MSERSPSFNSIVRANPRGWLIAAFIFSARSTLGLIMPTWEQELGWGRTFVSMGGSVILVVMTLISPLAGHSAGGAAGAMMGGYFFDTFNSYAWVWIASIVLAMLAAVFSWMIRETRDTQGAAAPAAA